MGILTLITNGPPWIIVAHRASPACEYALEYGHIPHCEFCSSLCALAAQWGFLHGHQPSLLRSYGWQAGIKNFDEVANAARRNPEGDGGLVARRTGSA
jgi:hypothetical protein